MKTDTVQIRPCQSFEELDACVQLQSDVWGWADRDLVPRRVFIVAQNIGGLVIGAFDGGSLVGFALAIPGISQGQPYLYSYMLGVDPDYRNQGIGRRLKLSQREEALARGIRRIQWTFDPLEIKNSYLNLAKLGTIVRRYSANFYGVSSSRLHGQVPTDRLYAEWWLDSEWACRALAGNPVPVSAVEQEISTASMRLEALACRSTACPCIQTSNREHFEQAFADQLAVIGFRIDAQGNGVFQLGRWQEPAASSPE